MDTARSKKNKAPQDKPAKIVTNNDPNQTITLPLNMFPLSNSDERPYDDHPSYGG